MAPQRFPKVLQKVGLKSPPYLNTTADTKVLMCADLFNQLRIFSHPGKLPDSIQITKCLFLDICSYESIEAYTI